MAKSVLQTLLFNGIAKITGLPLPVDPSDAVIKQYVDAPGFRAPVSQLFNTAGAWQTYTIPDGAQFLHLWLVGPGGNGGSGFTRSAGSPGAGGGGGGSGAISNLIVPVARLGQSTLYVLTGAGSGGRFSIVAVKQDTAAQNTLLRANGGSNANNGTASAGGSAGAAGTLITAAGQPLASIGVPGLVIGQVGIIGGGPAGVVGGSIVWGATGDIVSSGASGAGCTTTDFAGGSITTNGSDVMIPLAGGAANGGPGLDGITGTIPYSGTGGSGGGSDNDSIGGKGGNGAPGCGGGGGGAGTAGGAGGLGGPGLALITAYF